MGVRRGVVVYRVAFGEPGPGADVDTGWARSWRRCGHGVGPVLAQIRLGEPSPGADVAGVGPVLAQMWQGRTRRGIAQQLSTGK
jgi:hypothetical protein